MMSYSGCPIGNLSLPFPNACVLIFYIIGYFFLIYELIQDYYYEVAGKNITSGLVLSHQTSGDFARVNPHWHGILLEGGFDDEGNFVYLPISSTKDMPDIYAGLRQMVGRKNMKLQKRSNKR